MLCILPQRSGCENLFVFRCIFKLQLQSLALHLVLILVSKFDLVQAPNYIMRTSFGLRRRIEVWRARVWLTKSYPFKDSLPADALATSMCRNDSSMSAKESYER
ncbi:uncharacterized protein ARMOST_00017 [Armillaria ostoyae]|uniref:Uncharacterized protein n=1 Tax=Armillaria ostoyae TaxID=47428 RepID=A0A284QJY9_ARMOS|nr:uncharacterized protein ARMOST_00017 [Armillaria ostoyae]